MHLEANDLKEGGTMRRIVPTLLASVTTVLLLAPPAHAARPTITPGEPFSVDIPFPDVCPDFEMVATVSGRTHTITFVDGDGNVIRGWSGGQLFVTWTRTDTDFSRTFSIAGPTFLDSSGTAVHGTGRWTTPLEGTGWVLANGNLTFDGFQDGFSLISSYKGNVTPICDLMS
jgi:hypothetical protein